MNLIWTISPPEKAGWYWYMNRIGATGVVFMDDALIEKAKKHYELYVAQETDFALHWAGPLQEPEVVEP